MNKTQRKRPWHPIELGILQHVGRYGLTTTAALVCRQVKGVWDYEQARYRLNALVRRGDLNRLRLAANDSCYLLTPQSVGRLNQLEIENNGLITNQIMLRRCYSLLQLYCAPKEPLRALLPRELQRTIPALTVTGRPSMFCVSQSNFAPLLIYVRVDHCGRGRWDRLAWRAAADMQRLRSTRALAPFIQRGQLELRLVTVLREKGQRLAEILTQKQQQLGIKCRVIAMPQLQQFVQPQSDKTGLEILSPALRGS